MLLVTYRIAIVRTCVTAKLLVSRLLILCVMLLHISDAAPIHICVELLNSDILNSEIDKN